MTRFVDASQFEDLAVRAAEDRLEHVRRVHGRALELVLEELQSAASPFRQSGDFARSLRPYTAQPGPPTEGLPGEPPPVSAVLANWTPDVESGIESQLPYSFKVALGHARGVEAHWMHVAALTAIARLSVEGGNL